MRKLVILFILTLTSTLYAQSILVNDTKQRHQIIQTYLSKLNQLDADGAIALFIQEGTVISRHQGEIKAIDFFPGFVEKFIKLEMKELMFFKTSNKDFYALEIGSAGIKKTGEPVSATFMVIFQFAKNDNQFEKITIFANDTLSYPPR
ncbi:Uncharacterised protein [Legionella busanensis]|uniref:SnoaL-like domain n=1 Tax=Legionella busanensis TaxID=190655 RepID=A0A378JW33_9GAMM|nr:hypothetical protein [Legionella busanensis]STX52422.1 Uncharacterised protein [Legionella busanensis]